MDTNFKEYVNVEEAISRLGGNKMLYGRLVEKFIEDGYVAAVKNAFQSGNEKEVIHQVHALKGVCANLSLKKIASSCVAFEDCIKNGLDYTDIKNELIEAINETEKVLDYHFANEMFKDN